VANTTGGYNTGVGSYTLDNATTASYNTACGYQALGTTTTGNSNASVGYNSLVLNTTGSQNCSVGYQSLYSNTTASNNTAVGTNALYANTTGEYNVAVGAFALDANTASHNNVAVGTSALTVNTGGYNTALGHQTLSSNTTGNNNTCVGHNAGAAITTGTYNTFVGLVGSGGFTTGNRTVLIGAFATPSAAAVEGEIVINSGNATTTGIGTGTALIAPHDGTGNNGAVYQGNNSSAFATTSDERIKKNIVNNNIGLDIINQIQVRNFEYRNVEEITDFENPDAAVIKKEGVQLGVIAQEIQKILPDIVKTESTGVKTVNPDNLTWYLVNAIKELSTKITALEAK